MNRQMFNAMAAQYATPEVSGDGLVSWDSGKKCVIPSIKLHGAAVQDGEPTPDAPIMPVCNNGVFAGRGRNLFDSEGFAQELLALNDSSRVTVDGRDCVLFYNYNAYSHGPFFPFSVRENTQYTIKMAVKADGIPETGPGSLYINLLYTDGTVTAIFKALTAVNAQDWVTAVVSTEPDKTLSHLALSYGTRWDWYIDISSIQMVEGSYTSDTMPPYTPYYDGGQAQAPELWTIPGTDYQDEWNPQTGRGIRRVKKIVLDGVSDVPKFYEVLETKAYWNLRLLFGNKNDGNAANGILCSHIQSKSFVYNSNQKFHFLPLETGVSLGFATVDDLNNFCAEQYAAGTPVTIWYALAEPEPFYSPPAKLTMPTGYGQIVQVSGDVPDCPITAKYLTHS